MPWSGVRPCPRPAESSRRFRLLRVCGLSRVRPAGFLRWFLASLFCCVNLSPATMSDTNAARDWLDLFEFTGGPATPGIRAQRAMDHEFERVAAYRAITVPCLAIGFADDRMIPPYLSREVADAIPGARYQEIPDTGHYGYLERPEAVNKILLDFFAV
ncbi:alpha/beta fold hydrolase [Amycolatopsis sp. NPDC003676]